MERDINYEGHATPLRKPVRLKEDVVIPKGTVLEFCPRGKRYAFYNGQVLIHPDSGMSFAVWQDILELRPDLFEEVEE